MFRKLLEQLNKRKYFRGLVVAIAAVVVFATTYSLILPAITMEADIAASEPGITLESVETADAGTGSGAEQEKNREKDQEEQKSAAQEQADNASAENAPQEDSQNPDGAEDGHKDSRTQETGEEKDDSAASADGEKTDAKEADAKDAKDSKNEGSAADGAEKETGKTDGSRDSADKDKMPAMVFEAVLEKSGDKADTESMTPEAYKTVKKSREQENTQEQSRDKGKTGDPLLKVTVVCEKGAFPAGTVMRIEDVSRNRSVRTAVSDAVEGTVNNLQAVDITFFDQDGKEIEPKKEIRVTITSDMVKETEAPVIVHLPEKGNAEVIRQTDEKKLEEKPAADEIVFDSDRFSVYAVVETVIEKTVLATDGKNYRITVTCDQSSGIPEDADLSVREVTGTAFDDYIGRTAVAMQAADFAFARVFDISIVDRKGTKLQPESPVQVTVKLLDAEKADEFAVVHFAGEEETPEQMDAETDGNTVSFDTAGFSAYAIVQGPDAVPLGWKKITSLEQLLEVAGENGDGVYIGQMKGYYFTDQMVMNNNNPKVESIKKTKPAQSYPAEAAARYYFEAVEGSSDQVYFYCYDENGQKKYVITKETTKADQLLLEFSSEKVPAGIFSVKFENDSRVRLYLDANNNSTPDGSEHCLNMANGDNGAVFGTYNKPDDQHNYFYIWQHEEVTAEPYGLEGKSYGLMYWNDSIYGKAMMSSVQNGTALSAKELLVMNKKTKNADKLFVPNDADISMWTFEWAETDYYYLKTTVDGAEKYLSVSASGISLSDTKTDTCKMQVLPGSGANAHKISLRSSDGQTLSYSGKLENGFKTSGQAGSEWLYLVEPSELTSNYVKPYSAQKVSVSDPSVTNGSQVIVYTRVWNKDTKKYEEYAIDHDGSLVRCYESGDNIEWIGGQFNTMLWDFVEYYWEGTTDSNDYYELYNQFSKKYLAPQITGGQILSDDTIGIHLNGRHDGYYQSDILAWDNQDYTYAGLKVENGKLVTCPRSEAMDFYFAIVNDPPVDDELTTVPTVDHEQYGITMKIKDYTQAKNINQQDTSQEQHDVLGTVKYQTGKYNPGLLSTNLDENGYPTALGTGKSLSELYSGARKVNHLFIGSTYSGSGYFEYDSTQNFAHLNDDNTFTVYKELGTTDNQNTKFFTHGQFMPFNDISAGVYSSNAKQNLTTATGANLPDTDPRKYERLYQIKNPNYYYGVEIEASFTQTANGLDDWGHDIIYEFTGDDDFWLYVDGELIVDLGGIHDAMTGTVNYSTGEVVVNGQKTTLRALFESNFRTRNPEASDPEVNEYLAQYFDEGSTIFKDYTTHHMKIFYMERGAGAANLHMRFNLASVKPGTVELTKELNGIENGASVLAEFPYQIYYQMPGEQNGNEPVEHLLVPSNEDGITVRHKNTVNDVTFQESFDIPGTELTYQNVFMVKPGETIVIDLPDDAISYRIVECGVNTDVYGQVAVNGMTVSGTEITNCDNRKDFGIDHETAQKRPMVKYVNQVKPEALRTLHITKKLYKEDGTTQLNYSDDDTTFSLRLYLGTEFDTAPDSARMYSYRIKDTEGHYCKWDAETQRLVSTDWTSTASLSDAEKKSIHFDTSLFGSIAKIPAFYTIEVPNLLAGTTFKVQERPNEVPDGYSFTKYEYKNENYTDAMTGVTDVVQANADPEVDVVNLRGWGLRINKIWSDADYMEDRDATYFAVFTKDADGKLTIVPSTITTMDAENNTVTKPTPVRDEAGNATTIVRQLEYGQSSIYWYFPQLPVNDTALGDYVIREVTLTGAVFDADGNLTGYSDSAVAAKGDGDELCFNGKQKGESDYREFSYTVKYEQGTVAEGSQVRVDKAGNSRPGILLKKTDWSGNPLKGSVFELKDASGTVLGTFASDEQGVITTAFLSNDGAQYTLTETKTPQGYQGLPGTLTISQKNGTVSVEDSFGGTEASGGASGAEGSDDGGSAGTSGGYYKLTQGTGTDTSLVIKNRPYTLQVVKKDLDTGAPLSGVRFQLHKQHTVGGTTQFDTTPLTGYTDLSTDTKGILPKIDNTLPAGTYQLREKSTKTGYQTLSGYIEFTVSDTGVITLLNPPEEVSLSCGVQADGTASYTMTILNSQRKKVSFKKVDIANPDTSALEGAEFALYAGEEITDQEVPLAGFDGLVSNANGMLSKNGNTVFELPVGKYHLIETKAPSGYILKATPVVVEVKAGTAGENAVVYQDGTNLSGNGGRSYNKNTGIFELKISNTAGYALPSTGGIGTRLFYILGGILVLGAVVLLAARKRVRGDVRR